MPPREKNPQRTSGAKPAPGPPGANPDSARSVRNNRLDAPRSLPNAPFPPRPRGPNKTESLAHYETLKHNPNDKQPDRPSSIGSVPGRHPVVTTAEELTEVQIQEFIDFGLEQFEEIAGFAAKNRSRWNLGEITEILESRIVNLFLEQITGAADRAVQRLVMLGWDQKLLESLDQDQALQNELRDKCAVASRDLQEAAQEQAKQLEDKTVAVREQPPSRRYENIGPQQHGLPDSSRHQRKTSTPMAQRETTHHHADQAPEIQQRHSNASAQPSTSRHPSLGSPASRGSTLSDNASLDYQFGSTNRLRRGIPGPASEIMRGIYEHDRSEHDKIYQNFKLYRGDRDLDRVFGLGSAIAVFWHENMGEPIKSKFQEKWQVDRPLPYTVRHVSGFLTFMKEGAVVFSHVRRFIVVKKRHGFSVAVPINSYSGNGLAEKKIPAKEWQAHTIVYSDGQDPKALPNEPKLNKNPICVSMLSDNSVKNLKPTSRLYYGKPYSIEHNTRIWHLGQVIDRHLPQLLLDYNDEARATQPGPV